MPPIARASPTLREVVLPAGLTAPVPITLKELLASLGSSARLTVSTSLFVATELARAIGELHERGSVHGLLSPGQVQVGADGSVRVLGPEGAPRPATPYLAPEVRNGGTADVLADVHAIGAITYELLAGMTVLQAFVRAPMRELTRTPPPSLFNPGVDSAIDELITKAVDRDRSLRPHSVRALLAGIDHCFGELDLEPDPAELAAVVRERFPAAALIPVSRPIPAPVVEPPGPGIEAPRPPAPSAKPAESSAPAARTVRHDVRRRFAGVAAELDDDDFEEETTGSTEIPVPFKWLPSRKVLSTTAGAAVLLAAGLLLIVARPSSKPELAEDVPVAKTEAAVRVVPVPIPAPVPEAAPPTTVKSKPGTKKSQAVRVKTPARLRGR